jgi:hypothetical protein
VGRRRVHLVAAASVVLSLVVRLYWVFRVQSPYIAVRSDMAGYVGRALALLSGTTSSFPRLTALYPYGAHYAYAAEFYVVGYAHASAVCVIQALLGALPAYFFVLFASRWFSRAWAPALLGFLFAIWQPLVCWTGFFLSEVPYVALLFLNAWLCVRFLETRRGALALGLTGALLFAVRPQFILTFALLAAMYLWWARSRLFRRSALAAHARVLAPWVVVLAFSVGRYHHLTGRWGLISQNGQLNRLFADTTVGKIESHWRAPNGEAWDFWISPPTKTTLNEHEAAVILDYFGDPDALEAVRLAHLRDKTIAWRMRRALANVRLLWTGNYPWPEEEWAQARGGVRRSLQHGFNDAVRVLVLPLAVIGAVVHRNRKPFLVVLAHLLTLVTLSIFFLPEARYRTPYDPFLLLLALAGMVSLTRRVRSGLKVVRRLSLRP